MTRDAPGGAEAPVRVRYFAAARAAAGLAEETVGLRAGALDAAGLRRELGRRHPQPPVGEPALHEVLELSSLLCEGLVLEPGDEVPAGAVVDVLPPFAGG
ncbi:MoaD/ThiS family protein [Brevibacterium sp. 50QC2O2]|uniref:MoaD/ThiS family protein n=1 Tax=Brevibacterium TaxID=1696 RepID=UPI00211C1E23|nr:MULTISPECIES: MoaD/ThiS family protein [unclassified Brevibacterium]MCQ9368790.1 MoaD/ThiS family protein [Brevibacterium sp. 91QC2O2]MCQ9386174.1 MoaD/ThiS family protein [Brevibacterium sp. 68QC2CO]MCQ9388565.1 MoaD/ThiS family protein [Brevibacterium sp. 50QC2O2]